MTVSLRPIRTTDLPFLYQVYASTRADEMAVLDWSEKEKAAFLKFQFDAQHKHYQEYFSQAAFDVVLLDGQPIGRLYVDRRADEIRIVDIALLPAYRGRGIGAGLMRSILDEAARAALPVRIHVEQYNRALSLYRRLGFEQVGETGVYLLMEWQPGSSDHSPDEKEA